MVNYLMLVISFCIGIIFPIVALVWLNELEKINCKCSEHWERKYLKIYYYFIIGWIIFNFIFTIIFKSYVINNANKVYKIISGIIFIIIFIVGFSSTAIAIDYINRLKKINCTCSEDIKREITYVISIINVIAYCILSLIMFMIFMSGIDFFTIYMKSPEELKQYKNDLIKERLNKLKKIKNKK
jgi:hypothetical protein